jgi:hypothetical protein
MKTQLVVGLAFCLIGAAGCESRKVAQQPSGEVPAPSNPSDEDVAAETLNQMLDDATKGDWQSYVDHHYGEQHKFRSTADRDALVKRFEEKCGVQLVEGLSRAAKLPVHIDGDTATFSEGDDTVFVLHRSADGGWKFHL